VTCFGPRAGQWFFADNLLAGSSRLKDHIVVQVGWGANIDHVHIWQHIGQLRVNLRSCLCGKRPGFFHGLGYQAGDLWFW
jgi:hypothetical protein